MTQLPGPLVNADWLAEHLGAPDLRVLEATVHLTPEGWRLRRPLGPGGLGRGPHPGLRVRRPDRRALRAARLAELHVPLAAGASPPRCRRSASRTAPRSSSTTATATMWATRLWWLLHAYGFENAAVLDGGLAAWEGELTDAPAPAHEADFTPRPHPRRIADRAEVANGPACLINALAPAAFRAARHPGQHEPAEPRPARSGLRPVPLTRGAARATRRRRRARRRPRRHLLRRRHFRHPRCVRAHPAGGAGCGRLRRFHGRVDGGSGASARARLGQSVEHRDAKGRLQVVPGIVPVHRAAAALHRLTD